MRLLPHLWVCDAGRMGGGDLVASQGARGRDDELVGSDCVQLGQFLSDFNQILC